MWSTRRSPSWNLDRAKQGDTIRVDGTSLRGQGQEDVKESDKGVLQSAARPSIRPSVPSSQGRAGERRECDETSRLRREF